MRALVAMSGGVDSSVAAYLLKQKGLEVVGLSFELWDQRGRRKPDICCSVETIETAKEVAGLIGIEHITADVRDAFYRHIIEEFCSSYVSGLTPNPCILCNKFIKFRFLLKKAEEIGADIIATGHYARVEKHQNIDADSKGFSPDKDRVLLKKGVDPKKDQSYVLYVMTQEELSRTEFPLGGLNKDETRTIASKLGLASALRPESQEICFVGEGSYVDFIRDFAPDFLQPGPVVNMQGKVLGEHDGIAQFTIGQRKRLGIQTVRPYYVVDIDRKRNMVVVGSKKDVMIKNFNVKALNWVSISSLEGPLRVKVKIRSAMQEKPANIIPFKNQMVTVEFDDTQWAPASGQSAVFYDDDVVIGGGTIEQPGDYKHKILI
jgi:tRNA-specific 2-thiouridylase